MKEKVKKIIIFLFLAFISWMLGLIWWWVCNLMEKTNDQGKKIDEIHHQVVEIQVSSTDLKLDGIIKKLESIEKAEFEITIE